VNRDYPVVFATLYIFSLLGLVMNLITDLIYTWIDPRIDFESRQVYVAMDAPPPQRDEAYRTEAEEAGAAVAINQRRCSFQGQQARLLVVLDFPVPVSRLAGGEFIANDRPIIASYKGEILLPVFNDYPESKFGGFLARTTSAIRSSRRR
jgi:hypothetical protein